MVPVQVTFRDFDSSEAVEAAIMQKAEKLERYKKWISSCHVVVSAPELNHHRHNTYHINIHCHVSGKDIVVDREPDKNDAHDDIYIAIRDAFKSLERQVESYVQRHGKKHH